MALEKSNQSLELTPDVKKQLVAQLGGFLHDEWRAPRKQEDGTYESRVKVLGKTQDGEEEWYNEVSFPEGEEELQRQDIANTNFEDLVPYFQADNQVAAEVAMREIFKQVESGELLDAGFIEAASSVVHDEWVKRTSWAEDSLKVPFDELPEDEKEKDRAQVKKGIELLNRSNADVQSSVEKLGLPGKKGDKVVCHYEGRSISGVIIADDVMGRDIKGILLEEKVGNDDDFMGGYGLTVGPDVMNDPSKIEKTGECTDAELIAAEARSQAVKFGK